jgi:sugar O-acyltransferase (sialic acid O-acetyltransferase NeuD family)
VDNAEIYIIGASGHGKVIASTIIAAGFTPAGFFDDDSKLHGSTCFGLPVLGGHKEFATLVTPQAIIGIGDGKIRQKITGRYTGGAWISIVHPSAWMDSTATIKQGTVVFAGAVIQPDVMIKQHCIINTGATIDHDCGIDDFVHICPGVNLAGNVTIGKGAWVGIGSQILQGVSIGEGSIIGAGATVINDIPPNVMAVGTPARVIKKMENGDRRMETGKECL